MRSGLAGDIINAMAESLVDRWCDRKCVDVAVGGVWLRSQVRAVVVMGL